MYLVLTDRRSLLSTRPKSSCGKSSSCWLSFLAARNAITKDTEYVTFGFSFHILSSFPSRKVWTSLSLSDTNFLVFKQPLSEKIPTNDLGLKMVETSPFLHQPDRVARKASDVQQLIGDIKHTWKIRCFFSCVVTAFLRAGNPCITP